MQRITPMPQYPANELILRAAADGNVAFTPTFTNTLTLKYGLTTDNYPQTLSDTEISATGVSAGDDVIVTGNVSFLRLPDGANVSVLVLSDTITEYYLMQNIEVVDLRNAKSYISVWLYYDNVREIYAIANTTAQKHNSIAIINQSTVTNGTLWINASQLYAADVMAAAMAKGWSVRYL